jgi:hypothetical protein
MMWQFTERLAETGSDGRVWKKLQRQLDERELRVR